MSSRVLLAMSGGVDSSVSAYLLREQGYDVVGLFMRTGAVADEITPPAGPVAASDATSHASDGGRSTASGSRAARPSSSRFSAINSPLRVVSQHQGCCSALDAGDARRVADKLDIPFYAFDFEPEFRRIIDYFVDEYTVGRTPNPCVVCNNWLKFGRLWEYAQKLGADYIATGHYARMEATRESGGPPLAGAVPRSSMRVSGCSEYHLLRAVDPGKDQSYVLFGLPRELLPRVLFPVGRFTKPEIRAIAREAGFRVADKPDSQEICFVAGNHYLEFVRRHKREGDTSGEIVDTTGRVVGRHDGIEAFTVGQRKGLGIAFGEPRYVVAIDAASRRVVIGTRRELERDAFEAERVNWLIDVPAGPVRCEVKIRYLHTPAAGSVEVLRGERARVILDTPQPAVTPGQAAVFYDGPRVLGGGWICSERPPIRAASVSERLQPLDTESPR